MDVAPGGYRYGLAIGATGLVAALVQPVAGLVLFALAVGAVWFHRDPERSIPNRGVVAPADGTVQVLREEDGRLRVGTFMNVDDVHVNRAPVCGRVTDVEHVPGAHRPAFTKASDRNERVHLELESDAGQYTVTMIAGAFARRIHPYVSAEQSLDRGERIGHISFGSRVDVVFPPAVDRSDLAVQRGDTVCAGESLFVDGDVPPNR